MRTIVITMAGMGSRFREAGYQVPKYQIEALGKTLFEWSLSSLEECWKTDDEFYFIVRREDQAEEFIRSSCKKFGICHAEVLEIDYLTDGQATTAMMAAKNWKSESELLIYNIDTYVEPGVIRIPESVGDGFIPCFHGEGSHWSFVKLDENQRAVEVREKERISDHCTLGAYYFKTCRLYEELYQEYYQQQRHMEKGEKYIAPLYNLLISKGGDVRISIVSSSKVHVLGTPKELRYFLDRSEVSL